MARDDVGQFYLNNGLLIHRESGPHAVYRLETTRAELLSDEQIRRQAELEAQRLVALTGLDCHMVGVPRPFNAVAWLKRLIAVTPNPNPGFEELLEEQHERTRTIGTSRRAVYLAVKLEEAKREDVWETLGVSALFRKTDVLLGTENPRPSAEVLEHLGQRVQAINRKVALGRLQAEPATAGELRWLLMRPMWRGLAELPEPASRETWAGESRALFDGAVVHNGHRWLRIELPGFGEFYVSTIGLHRFPDELPVPGGEWLAASEELPFPVEFSTRFRVLTHREASKEVTKVVRAVLDQIRHIQETPTKDDNPPQVPMSLQEKGDIAQQLEYEVKNQRQPLLKVWARLVVTAGSEEQMEQRLEQTVAHHKDLLDIEGSVATGDQWELFKEGILGFPFKSVNRYIHPQTMQVYTLAASGAVTSTSLGDSEGPYYGVTAVGGDPVHIDVFRPARVNGMPLILVAGRTGSGKSNGVYLLCDMERARGTTVVLMDRKEEANGLAELGARYGRVNKVRLDEGSAGRLDPYRIFHYDRREASELAGPMLRSMLSVATAEDVEEAINIAAGRVRDDVDRYPRPNLMDVVDQLEQFSSWGRVPFAVGALRAQASSTWGQVCFATGDVPDLEVLNALTILQFKSLPLAEIGVDPRNYTQPNRMAGACQLAMTGLVSSIINLGTPEDRKMAVFDEVRGVFQSADGRAAIERYVLQWRALGGVPVIVSQNASHFDSPTLRNNAGSIFIYELPDPDEARLGCELMQIEPTDDNIGLIQNLAPKVPEGERAEYSRCLYRDPGGRVGMILPDLSTERRTRAFDTTPGMRFGLRGFEGLEEDEGEGGLKEAVGE